MQKIISVILASLMLAGILSGCSTGSAPEQGAKLHIVTTIFPVYDWVCQILGQQAENAEITLLMDSGVDLHNYQPTVDDMVRISTCDLFLYVGGESDAWVTDALGAATNQNMAAINLMEVLGEAVKEEEIIEGMEHDHEHEEDEHEEESHEEESEHHHEMDEHIWLSLNNARVICTQIAQQLASLDSANADVYIENAEKYCAVLEELDTRYRETVNAAARDTLLFADRFPFRYLVDDYGISYYAAFSGCSAETEASFETVAFLAGKVDELGLTSVMTIEGTDHSIAETVIRNTAAGNQSILALNSMQSVTAREIQAGTSYLSIMESNLEVLKKALN